MKLVEIIKELEIAEGLLEDDNAIINQQWRYSSLKVAVIG
jgi:hypothetical protein